MLWDVKQPTSNNSSREVASFLALLVCAKRVWWGLDAGRQGADSGSGGGGVVAVCCSTSPPFVCSVFTPPAGTARRVLPRRQQSCF